MQKDFIIVGQGLAGSLLALNLLKQGKSVLIIDDGNTQSSSQIAAGMFTPISGKRMVKSWMVDELYPVMQKTYTELETLLGTHFLINQHIQLSLASIKEQNDFFSALTDKINPYVVTDIIPHPGLQAPFGAVEIKQSGWLNTVKFLESCKNYFIKHQSYLQQNFDFDNLQQHQQTWVYQQNYQAGSVIFCQGYKNKNNPFFNHIPVIDNKGDVFKISTQVLDDTKIYKRGAYAVNLGNNEFKVGSTYKWDNDDTTPTQAGFDELKLKTDAIINGPYQVLNHWVGIRPTTRDRRPILGKHTTLPHLYIFNGLGTKGVLVAPHFSQLMADFILHQKPIPNEVNVTRFEK